MTESIVHSATRTILASPRAIYRAFLDAESVASWRAPKGMTAKVFEFDARPGGGYRMTFVYEKAEAGHGKSTEDADVFTGRFIELVPDEKIVEAVQFESADPAFAGTMTITTLLSAVRDGTKVTFVAEHVPPGISAADHTLGMDSSLKNLANLLE
ncbi:SRPBCC family protein [Sphingobium sp. 3R8]|uniref:SRPBCC family protein n=1 Tax=Sphingobium sp. 3R8 TaxID=2874921 RepID=UPI001CC9D915|nr:SRPBCC family protein [Sphingobium sp. 3R8]MBZ9648124.1 SRPBCC family protein [Sphingobium sp. 3R8]